MNICVLGISGSIGKQTLDIIEKYPDCFTLVSFSVGKHTRSISSILRKHPTVTHVFMLDNQSAKYYREKYPNVTFLSKRDGLRTIITLSDCEMVVNALVGFVGLEPSLTALQNNKKLALANKESLVVGGQLINSLLANGHGVLYPIDSEHSTLMKCLMVDSFNVHKLMLTASGGAFRKLKLEDLQDVTIEDALKHPTWKMGKKITVDCATMMNKAFELVEAYHLYGYEPKQLGITLHDESYLHSYVVYNDGEMRGELNRPNMKNPIQFALFECKFPYKTVTFSKLSDLKGLHFHDFDMKRYPLVKYGYEIIEKGGAFGAIVNAANEIAVNAFINHQIGFLDIDKVISYAVKHVKNYQDPDFERLVKVDMRTRRVAKKFIREGL